MIKRKNVDNGDGDGDGDCDNGDGDCELIKLSFMEWCQIYSTHN